MRIVDINGSVEKMYNACFPIPLLVSPFLLISFERKPTFSERREMRRRSRFTARQLRLGRKDSAIIRYSDEGRNNFQFIKFSDLINCEQ